MRVIGGRLSGQNFNSVTGNRTHPMSEKIRGALFNSLGDIQGLSLLDVYSGTGAIGIEAASRGADYIQSVESDQPAIRTIHENIEKLGLVESIKATRAFALAWSRRHQNDRFDIVIMDPPYNAVEPKELLKLSKHCKPGGVVVLSLPPNSGFRYGESQFELLSYKNYGDAELYFYRKI